MTRIERRRDARFAINRPVKLQCMQSGRFLTGSTHNLSASGALVEVNHPSLLVPGQRLRMGVAWTKQQSILHASTMLDVVVVRSFGLGDSQQVALAFSQRQALANAG